MKKSPALKFHRKNRNGNIPPNSGQVMNVQAEKMGKIPKSLTLRCGSVVGTISEDQES